MTISFKHDGAAAGTPAAPLTFGAGLWMFGQFVDRYATDAYGPPVSTLEAIARAGEVGSLEAVDINFPFSDSSIDVAAVRDALERNRLRAIAVTPAIYSREFGKGAFTNPDPAVRRKAIDLCKRAIDVAHALGSTYVKFWPGQDGFDYPFQSDYLELWDLSVAGVRDVAASDPQMAFAIEYKAKEPRAKMTFGSAARTLLAIADMAVDNVGVVMDLGHSLFAKEAPAEELQLLHRRGKLRSIELNDNWREWDDDLTVGSIHLVETLEFLAAVRRIGWSQPLLLDQFPFRESPIEAARRSIATIRALDRLLGRVDLSALRAAQARQDALAAQRLIHELFLGELGGRS